MSFTTEDLTFLADARKAVAQKMFGLDKVTNALIIALLARSHVLLEGNPGLGKTALVREIGRALGLDRGSVGRIQFTPDLMPSDITGTEMPVSNATGMTLEFKPGPVFCRLLIADEINRATPKTQAAMLEAMAEQQVTVLGRTYPLAGWMDVALPGRRPVPVRPPFLVMATQNPVDQEGVFPLPEAQADRFMFKVRMPFPNADVLSLIIDKESEVLEPPEEGSARSDTAPDEGESLLRLHRCTNAVRAAPMPDPLRRHILNMVMASCGKFDQVAGLSGKRQKALEDWTRAHVVYELGPRAATAMRFAAIGWDALTTEDPANAAAIGAGARRGLAATVLPVLRHRMKFDQSAGFDDPEALFSETDFTDDRVAEFATLAAPDEDEALFAAEIASARGSLL
jgi:MoxR-like ATPase